MADENEAVDNNAEENESAIDELKDPTFTENDTNETPPADIVSYNELRSCADLARMCREGVLDIHPSFQRDFVWKPVEQTKFIDSLIKRLPIPSMCLAFDYKEDKFMVIDGLQRISTIMRFLNGDDWKLSKLDDIDPLISGVSAAKFKNTKVGKLKSYFNRVENITLPLNILRCDFNKKDHLEYLFMIFHRLNSGGVKLNNQEIRNCIYDGNLNEMLHELDKFDSWRRINLMKGDENYRFVKQEIILRFFSFMERPEKYSGKVSKFLNDYMHDNRNISEEEISKKQHIFERVTNVLWEKVFSKIELKKIPTSVLEALLVAVAHHIDEIEKLDGDTIKGRYFRLRDDDNFKLDAVAEGLSKKDKVSSRFKAADRIMSGAA